jgi:hypothetical protein
MATLRMPLEKHNRLDHASKVVRELIQIALEQRDTKWDRRISTGQNLTLLLVSLVKACAAVDPGNPVDHDPSEYVSEGNRRID